uniref:Ion transport domain-containing protein n=1 Tax=Strombidium inclinatum TaxID=197538 RepID=A0A7S3IWC4_9SPIT|mmetsp:Transcript_5496/g.8586  ORF Transcript_5496/g.8586 Transcript_5496/m.8586 type:complete len:409 (+) Transcript_5496:924-2150(+)
MEWKHFDNIIIFLIACNSILLAIMDYRWKDTDSSTLEGTPKPLTNAIVDESEIFFTLCFTFEATVKILSMGLIMSKGCYLRDGWNCLDFAVVVTGLLQFIPGLANTSALRTFRLFRPLRSLSAIPSMKLLVNTLLNSVRQLSNILVLDNFFILTFAIFGLQMWQGTMHQRCRETERPVNGTWPIVQDDLRICGSFHSCSVACGSLYETTFIENGTEVTYEISEDIDKSEELKLLEFNYGITNFDEIGGAYLTIFQVTTLEGWADIMNMIQDGYNIYTGAAFFVVCVVTCSYFLLNLTVAVMLDKFKQLNQENTDRALHKYEKNQKRVQELKEMNSIMELRSQVSWSTTLNSFFQNAIYTDPGDPPQVDEAGHKIGRYKFKVCVLCWKMAQIPLFNSFILLLIVLNSGI